MIDEGVRDVNQDGRMLKVNDLFGVKSRWGIGGGGCMCSIRCHVSIRSFFDDFTMVLGRRELGVVGKEG